MAYLSKSILALELGAVLWVYIHLDKTIAGLLVRLGMSPSKNSFLLFCLALVSISFCFVCAVAYFSQRLRGRTLNDYGLSLDKFPSFKRTIVIFAASFILQILCIFAIEKPAEILFHAKLTTLPVRSVADVFTGIILGIIGGGMREELFFRGYLITKITEVFQKNSWSLWFACAFQILLFGFEHMYQGPLGVFETTIMAAIFTTLYLKTKSLWQSILLHSFYDGWGIIAIYLGY